MRLLFCVLVFYGLFGGGESKRSFEHRVRGSDFGHATDWELTSRGLVSHIVNLDSLPDVRVAENNQGEIIVNLRDTSITSGWQPGWFVIATNVRQRQGSEVKRISILKKIQHVYVISSSKVKVQGVDVSAIDLMKKAQIHLNYPHTSKGQHRRQKRYVSNLLSEVLDNINFHDNDTNKEITFNVDPRTGHSKYEYNVYKQGGQNVKVTKGQISSDVDFHLKCTDCFEIRKIGQVMDLEIERKNNTAHLKTFLLQNDVSATLNMDFEIEFKKALGVTERIVLDSTPPTTLRTIPVAVVNEKLPPIQLVVTYSKTVYLEINATASGPLSYKGKYHIQGHYTTTSTETSKQIPRTDVTTQGWRLMAQSSTDNSSKPYNISTTLYQEVILQSSVQWSQHDVSLAFTPLEDTSFRPLFYARTDEDVLNRCETATLNVNGIFEYNKSNFVAKESHKRIWDVLLRSKSSFDKQLATGTVKNKCTANCFKSVANHNGKTMDGMCGKAKNKIVRGDKEFNKLTVVGGNFILFRSEEGNNAKWCGTAGRSCRKCVWTDNGDKKIDTCADRLMTSEAAAALTTLGQFAAKEWPNRKLVVIEAWDEPTSHDPQGSHGATSLHYTGRALQVALTTENPTNSSILKLNTTAPLLTRLSELATCSGFLFANATSGHVQLCVSNVRSTKSAPGEPPAAWEKEELQRTLNKIKSGAVPIICKSHHDQQGQHYPPDQNREDVINPILDELGVQYRLIQYPHNDTEFKGEGSPDDMCFQPTRRCKSTCEVSSSEEPWDWCQSRVMTPRMALRIRRLATIVNQKHKGEKIVVAKPSIRDHMGIKKDIDYEKHGRKLQISSSLKIAELRSLAICAGFDYIETSDRSHIDVYVKLQDFQTTLVPFQHTSLLAVHVDDEDVAYPSALEHESRRTFLFDGFNVAIPLSEHFNISDFKHREGRIFRLDPALVDCLEMVVSDMEEGVKILAAYRNHSVNMRDVDHRPLEERLRFETGQAVYLTTTSTDHNALINLGQTILRSCTPVLRLQSRGLGIGCHGDKAYIDIRPMTSGDILDIADVWDVDNNPFYESIQKSMNELKLGGPAIFPLNLKRTCKEPRLGDEYAYYSFNTHALGFCFHDHLSKFCRDTTEYRKNEANKLRDQLIKVAGTTLTRGDIEHDLHTCVLDTCGGCPGKGPVWNKKVVGCLHMLHTFLKKARNPFKDVVDRAAFFNTDNADSSVHSLACHDESKCVEDTQVYSLLMPLLNSRYKPNPDHSQEELLYSGEDNPSPLISLVEQESAKQVAGVVKVYIESETDMSIMRDIIKIYEGLVRRSFPMRSLRYDHRKAMVLMIYNRKVTNVEFHLTEDVDQENVISALQRKLEHWAGTTCPMWSRFAVAPYSVHVIPHHRKKRSLERSKNRNEVKRSIKEWELDWIKNM